MATTIGQQQDRGSQSSGGPRSSGQEPGSELEHEQQGEDFMNMVGEVSDSVQRYCSSRPGVVAGVLFGLGFFCGWKLRPW